MGALHGGHLALMRRARRLAGDDGTVVVSVFVNPAQFGKGEDLEAYPKDLERDLALLREEQVDMIFAPTVGEIYPEGFDTSVKVEASGNALAAALCGALRAGHFTGVATVVTKLFNIVSPDVAVFGRKDYQQQLVIKKIVRDLNIDVEINIVDTMRESDGLAMSSRNAYLEGGARAAALCVPRALDVACGLFAGGERAIDKIKQEMRALVETAGVEVEYINICDAQTLAEATEAREGMLVAVSVKVAVMEATALAGAPVATLKSVRLIDNCILNKNHVNIVS
jgi:pantoate--beta-alanine ligase